MKEIVRYPHCFVCGEKNIHGLNAKFYHDGEKAFTEVTASEKFEGYRGIYHGGVISSLLDEVMIKAILAEDIFVVTAEMTIKYKRPVLIGEKLILIGKISDNKGKVYFTEGEVRDDKGTIYAVATGKYIRANDDLKAQLMKSLDQ